MFETDRTRSPTYLSSTGVETLTPYLVPRLSSPLNALSCLLSEHRIYDLNARPWLSVEYILGPLLRESLVDALPIFYICKLTMQCNLFNDSYKYAVSVALQLKSLFLRSVKYVPINNLY